MIDLLSVYHILPYPLRVVAASERGFYLRWRYVLKTERLVEEALERRTLEVSAPAVKVQLHYHCEQWAHR